jgi:hypothetical protein
MKLFENGIDETSEVKASTSRVSRMARYSAAAAGVAAVSSIEVDAVMVKVIVTDPLAQNTAEYTLDLSSIYTGADATFQMADGNFKVKSATHTSFGIQSAGTSKLKGYSSGTGIGSNEIYRSTTRDMLIFGNDPITYGFRVNEGGSDYTYGWFNMAKVNTNAFTLNSYGYNSTLNEAAIAGQGSVAGVPDSGPGIVGLALIGAGAAGVRLLRKLREGN